MSDLTPAQLAYLTSELGTDLDPVDAQTRYDRLGYVTAVALEVVRERLATMLRKSASMSLSGVMARDNSANIRALQEQATRLTLAYRSEVLGGTDLTGVGASSLVVGRRDRPR